MNAIYVLYILQNKKRVQKQMSKGEVFSNYMKGQQQKGYINYQYHKQSEMQIPTQSQEINYQQMLHTWKTNQRNSLSKQQAENYSKIYASSEATPGKQISFVHDHQTVIEKYSFEVTQYLKAKFIIEEIVEELEKRKAIDMADHLTVEFMHLICFRAWCDINSALKPFLNIKQKQSTSKISQNQSKIGSSNPEYEGMKMLAIPMFKLSEKIEKVFQLYHKCLSFKEKSFKFKLKSFVDFIFHKSEKNYRDKIVYGVEGVDFQRQQQLKYTEDQVIPQMRKKLLQYHGKAIEKVRVILLAYHRIMNIQFHKLESFDDFEVLKNTIIKQLDAKYKVKSFI